MGYPAWTFVRALLCAGLLAAMLPFFYGGDAEARKGPRAGKCNHGDGYHMRLKEAGRLGEHKRLCHRREVPQPTPPGGGEHKPNIVFVMSNDQDAATIDGMPFLRDVMKPEGTTYPNATYIFSLCCPSRASMLRGQYTHNHGVTTNANPEGYDVWRGKGYNASNLARWLDASGYRTGMFGIYLNGFSGPKPMGWDKFLLRKQGYDGSTIGPSAYEDEQVKDNSLRFLNENLDGGPLFMWTSYFAPHSPYTHDPIYEDQYLDAELPKPPSFNEEDVSDKHPYVSNWGRISPEEEAQLEADHRDRLRGLRTIDDGLRRMHAALRRAGELDNTYFVFWSDNGYMMGGHRLSYKQHPYVESLSFPMVVRGPGVTRGHTDRSVVMNQDVGPTFADIANAGTPSYVDGRSMLPLWRDPSSRWRNVGLIEAPENAANSIKNPSAFSGLRDENYTYVEYQDGFKEYYGLQADPHQLENSYGALSEERKSELSERVKALKDCAGASCRVAEDAP